jgi:hypothetical protein
MLQRYHMEGNHMGGKSRAAKTRFAPVLGGGHFMQPGADGGEYDQAST